MVWECRSVPAMTHTQNIGLENTGVLLGMEHPTALRVASSGRWGERARVASKAYPNDSFIVGAQVIGKGDGERHSAGDLCNQL